MRSASSVTTASTRAASAACCAGSWAVDSQPSYAAAVPVIYVTGHRNPDTDSIAAAIGYAELKRRLDPKDEYVPVRLGDCNPQTRWVLERAQAHEPRLLPHVLLRACDVMRTSFPMTRQNEPI